MVPHSFCWIRLVKWWIIVRLCTAQVWRGWDFVKTRTWWLFRALWIAPLIMQRRKGNNSEGRGQWVQDFFLDEDLSWDFSPWTCMKQVKNLAAFMAFWCVKQQRKHLMFIFCSLLLNHEAWITQTNSGAVFWLLNASWNDFVKNEQPSRYTHGCLKCAIKLHPSL